MIYLWCVVSDVFSSWKLWLLGHLGQDDNAVLLLCIHTNEGLSSWKQKYKEVITCHFVKLEENFRPAWMVPDLF